MVVNMSFWRNKKVLITGHTGFKGSWLALWLQQLGAHVVGFSLDAPTTPNLFSIADVTKNMISIQGDVRDLNSLNSVFIQHQPEIVFHMAAQSLVRYSYEHPVETYSTNVMGTVNLLQAARITGTVKAIVSVTSDKCYENKSLSRGYQEDDQLGGYDPYSNSKACAELVTSAFYKSYYKDSESSCGLASARAGNVIGGGDWAKDRLIPDLVNSFLNSSNFLVRYPKALRPWQHVLEPLHGYLKLAQFLYLSPDEYSQAWNFGPAEEDVRPVDWIVQQMQMLWDKELNVCYESNPVLHEATLLILDSSKAKNDLGWNPKWNLETALLKTVDWYRAYDRGEDMRIKTISQIEEYLVDSYL